MEIKSYKIIGMYKALEKLAKEDVDLRTAVKIAKNTEAIATPTKLIEEKQNNLLRDYAKKDENGEIIQNDDNTVIIVNPNEYFTKLQAIMDTDIDVEVKMIKLDDLEGIKLSAQDILALDPILEDEEKEADNKDE